MKHEQGSAGASTSHWGIHAGCCCLSSTAGRFGEGTDGCAPRSSSSATIRHYRLPFSSSSTHSLFTPLASRIAVCRIGHKQSGGSSVLGSTRGPHQLSSVGADFNGEQLKTEPGPYIFEKHNPVLPALLPT